MITTTREAVRTKEDLLTCRHPSRQKITEMLSALERGAPGIPGRRGHSVEVGDVPRRW